MDSFLTLILLIVFMISGCAVAGTMIVLYLIICSALAFFTYAALLYLNSLAPMFGNIFLFQLPQKGKKRIVADVLGANYAMFSTLILLQVWQYLTIDIPINEITFKKWLLSMKPALIIDFVCLVGLYINGYFSKKAGIETITELTELTLPEYIKKFIGM